MSLMKTIEQTSFRTEVTESYSSSDWMIIALIVAVGTFLRFWGLDNVGLHGDEKTTILPALAVLEQGGPYFPSGMFYARALGYTYLVSGSIWIFGESEWAVRLPSAIVGSIMPLLAFFLGKRFLSPRFNLLFIAAIAFLPAFIELSQAARMYVFWLAALMVFGTCVFRWERKDSLAALIVAFAVWMVVLQFHRLSVLALPIFLFPGLMNRSWRNLTEGAIAVGLGAIVFKIFGNWVGSHYPDRSQRPIQEVAGQMHLEASSLQLYWEQYPWMVLLGIAAGLSIFVWSGREVVQRKWSMALAKLIIGFGVIACSVFHYHVGVTALFVGATIWLRTSLQPRYPLYCAFGVVVAMAIFQTIVLYQTGEFPGRQIVGAFVGVPSIWPLIRFGEYSPVAAGFYVVVLAYGFYRLANRQQIPDHILLFMLSVWLPLVAIGTQTWYPQLRYMSGSLPFFLLCCLAGLQYLADQMRKVSPARAQSQHAGTIAAILLVILIVNPIQVAAVVNSGYERHPDHKGAAEYLKGLPISDDDIIIAEDVIQQIYYLGEVDYWLRTFDNARGYSIEKDGKILDQYTDVTIIGDGDALIEVLDANLGRRVFIVGSGEIIPGRDQWARSRGIAEVLRSERLRVDYEGRDGITKVWVDGARGTD